MCGMHFPTNLHKMHKNEKYHKFPYISFIYLLQPSPTEVHHIPMTEMLVNRMQWKSKQKNMVKYQGVMCLLYKKQRRETGVKGQRD